MEKSSAVIEFVKWGVRATITLILVGAATTMALRGADAKDWFIALASLAAGFWLAKET